MAGNFEEKMVGYFENTKMALKLKKQKTSGIKQMNWWKAFRENGKKFHKKMPVINKKNVF